MQYATLREKIAAEKADRVNRYAKYQEIIDHAYKAGIEAGKNARPIPMYVIDQGIPIDRIDDGACGFAWINFAGNTGFGKWAKKQGIARSHYPSGLCVWVSEFGQSVDRKEAFAGAYARVLKENGIDAYAGSRLD
jgi:hypothetical protein